MRDNCGSQPLLGTVLLEQGALNDEDLERALTAQARNGERLGEILVELDLLSRPALDRAVAVQSGVDLQHEGGYGSGLRAEIERRHRGRRGLSQLEPEAVDSSEEASPAIRPSAKEIANGLETALSAISTRITELRSELERLSEGTGPAARSSALGA
jgi:hypothetical protein